MSKKVKVGIPLAALAIIVAAAGGSTFIIDQSQTNISDDDTTINQGDTNIFNEVTDRLAEEIVEAGIEACENDPDLAICP